MEWIEQFDRSLFILLNSVHHPVLDQIMWHISGKLEWIPLYIVLLYIIIKKYGKNSWIILVSVALLIALSDQISVKLFKETIQRYRPCHNLELQDIVQLVNNKCGGKYGFFSSHASNSFALAAFMGLLLGRRTLVLMLIWASVVGYSRIYMGVHYPLDVLAGGIFGISLAYLVFLLMNRFFGEKL